MNNILQYFKSNKTYINFVLDFSLIVIEFTFNYIFSLLKLDYKKNLQLLLKMNLAPYLKQTRLSR
jgi:hypothetical protein